MEAYVQALHYGLKSSPQEFEETQRRQIIISRLQAFVAGSVKVSEKEVEQVYLMSKQLPLGAVPAKFLADYEKGREALREKIRQEKSVQVMNRWFQQLGTNLKVKNNLEEIESRGGG